MTLQDLTKKNQEFVHIATNQLLADGKSDAEIKAILEEHLPEIIDNQKKGITARSLLGAPTTWAASFTERPEDKARVSVQKNTNPWLMWLDTSLLFLGLVTALNGLMLLFGQSNVNTGLISILTLGLVVVRPCTLLITIFIAIWVNQNLKDQAGLNLSQYWH